MLSRRVSAAASRGVTLIETIVVLVVLTVLLAQVMPAASDWIRGLKVRNAAESLRNGIERARMEALKRNSRVSLWMVADPSSRVPGNSCVLSSASPAWVVSALDPSGACATEPSLTDAPQLVTRSGASESADGISVSALSSTGGAANQVRFNGLGQVEVDANSIQIVDVTAANGSGRRLRVVVESGGAVRMCDRDVGSGDPRACPSL